MLEMTDINYILWDVNSRTEKRVKPLPEGVCVHNGHGSPFCVLHERFLLGRLVGIARQSAFILFVPEIDDS